VKHLFFSMSPPVAVFVPWVRITMSSSSPFLYRPASIKLSTPMGQQGDLFPLLSLPGFFGILFLPCFTATGSPDSCLSPDLTSSPPYLSWFLSPPFFKLSLQLFSTHSSPVDLKVLLILFSEILFFFGSFSRQFEFLLPLRAVHVLVPFPWTSVPFWGFPSSVFRSWRPSPL